MFNEYLFHLRDYTCRNVMCVCLTICGSNQKYFWSFYLLLEVICITHVFKGFQVDFMWKTWFLGVFTTHFASGLSHSPVVSLNGPIIKFFNFGQRVLWLSRECVVTWNWPAKISQLARYSTLSPRNFSWLVCVLATHKMPKISFLKGILRFICLKLLSFSPKPLNKVSTSKSN